MTTRRKFLLNLSVLTSSLMFSNVSKAATVQFQTIEQALNNSLLVIPVYGNKRVPHDKEYNSILFKINLSNNTIFREPSKIHNLHGLIEPTNNNPYQQKLGIGHSSKSLLQIYDKHFNNQEVKKFEDITFRGHGISYKDGVLITAESTDIKEIDNGILLYLDSNGNEINRFSTGGSRPHEIIDCGDFFAIAHYGDKPSGFTQKESLTDGCELFSLNTINSPGVSFVNKNDLTKHVFYPLTQEAKITHLVCSDKNEILAMGMSEYRAKSPDDLIDCAYSNNIHLLNLEISDDIYEAYVPLYKVSAEKGLIKTIDYPIDTMRRGQSFAFDPNINAIVATFAASQTLLVKINNNIKFLNSLNYGITDPRGCAFIPNSGLIAVSSNNDNVAIIDILNEKLIKIIGVPLDRHSHLYHFNI